MYNTKKKWIAGTKDIIWLKHVNDQKKETPEVWCKPGTYLAETEHSEPNFDTKVTDKRIPQGKSEWDGGSKDRKGSCEQYKW